MPADWHQIIQFAFVALAFVLAGATLGQGHTRWLGVLFVLVGLHGAVARLDVFAGTALPRFSYAIALGYGPVFYLALRNLLRRAETEPDWLASLAARGRALAPRFTPERERAAWAELLAELSAQA